MGRVFGTTAGRAATILMDEMSWKDKAEKRIDAVMKHAESWDEHRWADWWRKELERQRKDQLSASRRV